MHQKSPLLRRLRSGSLHRRNHSQTNHIIMGKQNHYEKKNSLKKPATFIPKKVNADPPMPSFFTMTSTDLPQPLPQTKFLHGSPLTNELLKTASNNGRNITTKGYVLSSAGFFNSQTTTTPDIRIYNEACGRDTNLMADKKNDGAPVNHYLLTLPDNLDLPNSFSLTRSNLKKKK